MRFTIPPSWWEPCVWWLRQCEWTKIGLAMGAAKNAHIATCMEMTIAFQLQTGIRMAPSILDMRSQEHAFRKMIRAIWSKSVAILAQDGNDRIVSFLFKTYLCIGCSADSESIGPCFVGSCTLTQGGSKSCGTWLSTV